MRKADAVDDLAKTIRRFRTDIVSSLLRRGKPLHPVKKYDKLFRHLLIYVRLHLTRLSKHATMPLDHVALSTRNLIEVALWATFIVSSRENIDRFNDEMFIDLIEISKVLDPVKLSKVRGSNPIFSEMEAWASTKGKHTDLKKHRAEDQFWYRFCSKIIHPTAWSINIAMKPKTKFASEKKVALAKYGLKSAIRAISTLTGLSLPSYFND